MWWDQAAAFCNALSEREGFEPCYLCEGEGDEIDCDRDERYETPYDCPGYRLPTEAEWEYAARAGTTTMTYNGNFDRNYPECRDLDGVVSPIAWFCGNSGHMPHPVAQKLPNQWGLYDMLGNVREWCEDRACSGGDPFWGFECEPNDRLGPEPATDPWGPLDGSGRITRGGSFGDELVDMSVSKRGGRQTEEVEGLGMPPRSANGMGFRPARTLEEMPSGAVE